MQPARALPDAVFAALTAAFSLGALVALATVSARPAHADEVIYDLSVVSDNQLIVGTSSTVAARVTAATDLNVRRAVKGAMVRVALVSLDAKGRAGGVIGHLGAVRSGADGRAIIEFLAPRVTSPRVGLRVSTDAAFGARESVRPISIDENVLLHLRTDRGLYRPGTPLRWRLTALHGVHSHPMSNMPVQVEVKNPSGAPIWRGSLTTDKAGMVSGEVPLADDAPTGSYTVRASAPERGASAQERVQVRQITLPPFIVTIEASPADPQPGQEMVATITARYPHGEPVAGNINVRASVNDLSLVRSEGKLDRFGRREIRFTPPIGERGVIHASVTDGAGRRREATHSFDLPGARLRLAIVPESSTLTAGKRHVYVITTDGRGTLVPATVRLEWTGAEERHSFESKGVIRAPIDVRAGVRRLRIVGSATADDGRVAVSETVTRVGDDKSASVRLAESVLDAGRAVDIDTMWPDRQGPVVATLLRQGVPLASTLVRFNGDRGAASLTPPTGSFGIATVRVTELRFEPRHGWLQPREISKVVYLDRRRLSIKIDAAVRHAPGEKARARVIVTHADGLPALGVHIAAAVVDERVLALSQPRPDLAHVLDRLGSGRANEGRGAAADAGLIFADLLVAPRTEVNRVAMRSLLAALPPDSVPAVVSMSEAARVVAEAARIRRLDGELDRHMFETPASLGKRSRGSSRGNKSGNMSGNKSGNKVRWQFASPLDEVLTSAGLAEAERLDPWKRPTTWRYARALDPRVTFEIHAAAVVERRLDALSLLLTKRKLIKRWVRRKAVPAALETVKIVPAHLGVDPWGSPIIVELSGDAVALISVGPDQRRGTADDVSRTLDSTGTVGYGYGSGGGDAFGALAGRTARAPQVRIGNAQATGGIEAAVRKRFDETVLWTTGVPTDGDGVVTLDVPLSDSVTGWQLDVEAVGPRGGVGVARGRFETHLARYVDATMPHGLTVGDRFGLPLVVANHTDKASAISLSFEARGAISTSTGRQRDVLEPSSTRAFPIELRASEPGEGVLKVTMRVDGKPVDAFERRLTVLHPGERVTREVGEMFENGRGTLGFEMDGAATGTGAARLRVFRGTIDRAIASIDTLVREPHGCFEQTSSATFPNLLVLRLLRSPTGPRGAPGLAVRAGRFIAKGYQRLISYEVDGGGFSWFGEAPANQVLTAYGLLEFTDMATVYPVDDAMVKRTRRWLLSKQRRDGSWRAPAGVLGGKSSMTTTAYITWALAESGYRGARLDRALSYLARHRNKIAGDGYALALWAAAEATATGREGRATRALADSLVVVGSGLRVKRAAGAPDGLFYARGEAADAQATALAAMAMHRVGKKVEVAKLLRWLGGDGAASWSASTQGTVLALRAMAMVGDDDQVASGVVSVVVNGERAGEVDLSADDLAGVDIGKHLRSGKNTVELRGDASVVGLISATVSASWRREKPEGESTAGLKLRRTVSASRARRGESIVVRLAVTNPGAETVEMPMVIAPIPPGFEARNVAPRRYGSYRASKVENVGSELRYYINALAPGETRHFEYTVDARNVADVLHRPARAYAYYQPNIRATSTAGRLEVTP